MKQVRLKGEWHGIISRIEEQNVLVDLKHQFPLSESEIEGDNGEFMIYLLSGSPGLFNGDRQTISCRLTDDVHLLLTNPSATELHPSLIEEECLQTQSFHLGKNSILEYVPEPLIPFGGSNFHGKTAIYMHEGSQAIIFDIVTAGRVGWGEVLAYQRFSSQFEVFWYGELQVWDSFQLEPAASPNIIEAFDHYTHMGTLWILSENITSEHLNYIQSLLPEMSLDCYGGVSLLPKNGMIIRQLGHSSQDLHEIMQTCWDYFRKELFQLQPIEVLK